MKRSYKAGISIILTLMLVLTIFPATVFAADAKVRYGSEQYEADIQEAFYIGVYVESDTNIGDFEVQLSYNPQFLTYVTGATSGGDGTITISGTANGTSVKYLVAFQALAGGDTALNVVSAKAQNADAQEELKVSTSLPAPIYINASQNERLSEININGDNLDAFQPDSFTYNVEVDADELDIQAEAPGCTVEVSDTTLSEETKPVFITVRGADNTTNIYTLNVTRKAATPAATDTENKNIETEQTNNAKDTQTSSGGHSIGKIVIAILLILVLAAGAFYVGLLLYDKKRRKSTRKKTNHTEKPDEEYDAEEKEDNDTYKNLYIEVQRSFDHNVTEPVKEKTQNAMISENEPQEEIRQEREQKTDGRKMESAIAEAMKKAQNAAMQEQIQKRDKKAPVDKPQAVEQTQNKPQASNLEKVNVDKDMINVSLISQELEKRMNHKEES